MKKQQVAQLPAVIDGEAPETDDDSENDENEHSNDSLLQNKQQRGNKIQGLVISGEDSESDRNGEEGEEDSSVSSAISASKSPTASVTIPFNSIPSSLFTSTSNTNTPTRIRKQITNYNNSLEKHDSLLHQKLRECNLALHKNLNSFADVHINEAKKTLNSIDQQLLQSQVLLQGSVSALREINKNSSKIKNKLNIVLTSGFLSNVRLL